MPPWSRSLLSAASSVIVNLSLSFMAVITSDSDRFCLCRIRLIGSYSSCMQFGCRKASLFFYTNPKHLWFHVTPVNIKSCRQPIRHPRLLQSPRHSHFGPKGNLKPDTMCRYCTLPTKNGQLPRTCVETKKLARTSRSS